MLRALGVGAAEERVYRALVARPSASVAELVAELAVEPAGMRRSLDLLAASGLVARAVDAPDRYVAAPPAGAIGALIESRRGDLDRVESAVAELAEQYRRAVGGRSVGDLVEVVTGGDAVRYRLAQARRGATSELATFVPAERGAVVEDQPAPRGVLRRVVLARGVLEQPAAMSAVRAAIRAGERVRVADRLPLRMTVADRTVAVVPLSGDGEPGAVLVHPSSLLDALVALFDAVWVAAVPLLGPDPPAAPDPAAGIDEEDFRILSLLLVGLTDRSVASQLGLSMRTVQRRGTPSDGPGRRGDPAAARLVRGATRLGMTPPR